MKMVEYILNKIINKALDSFNTIRVRDLHISVRKEIYLIFKDFFENKLNCKIQDILETNTSFKHTPFEEETYYNYFSVVYNGIVLNIDCYSEYLESMGNINVLAVVFNKIENKNSILFTLTFNDIKDDKKD